jgi:hypothetical protein
MPLLAQTKPDIRQTKAPASPPVVVVVFQNGKATLATLGAGLVLDTNASPPVLRAVAATFSENRLAKSGSAWALPASCGRVVVYRNGVRQWAGEDYTISGTSLAFRNGSSDTTDPSDPGDIVIAECWQ